MLTLLLSHSTPLEGNHGYVFSIECCILSLLPFHTLGTCIQRQSRNFLLNVVSFLLSHSTPLGRATLRYFLLEVTSLLLPFHDLVGQSRYFLLHVISFLLSHSTQSGHYDWLFLTFLSCQLISVVWWGSSRDWRPGLTLRPVKQFSSLVLPVGVCVVTNIPEVVAAGNGG